MNAVMVFASALAISLLPACKRNQQDAGYWSRERKTIELTKNLELLRYRYDSADFDSVRELQDYQNRLGDLGPRLAGLVSSQTELTSEIRELEDQIAELRRSRIEEIRAELTGTPVRDPVIDQRAGLQRRPDHRGQGRRR